MVGFREKDQQYNLMSISKCLLLKKSPVPAQPIGSNQFEKKIIPYSSHIIHCTILAHCADIQFFGLIKQVKRPTYCLCYGSFSGQRGKLSIDRIACIYRF